MTYKFTKFISTRIIYGKPRKVIVDICGDIINRNPTKEELKGLKKESDVRITRNNKQRLFDEEQKQYLLEFLRYFYEKEGRVPVERDFINNPKYPGFMTYVEIFGGWNNAIRAAGLVPNRYITDEELLEFLRRFYIEEGRPPTLRDFIDNPKYPGFQIYTNRFGSWENSLRLVGLDTDSMVRKGIIENYNQKARLAEVLVIKHFTGKVMDLSGKNRSSPYDGICPKGEPYDVKSSRLLENYWYFNIRNVNKDEIEWYYLLAFNEDHSELLYAWRVPAWEFMNVIEKEGILIGANSDYNYNLENMKEYIITDKLAPIFKDWLDKIQKDRVQYDKKLYDGCIIE